VSVLLRQPHGFEGVIPFEIGVNAGRLPVSLLMQMGYLSLDGDAASAPLAFGVQQHEVTLIAEIDHALRSPVDLRKSLREFVEQFDGSILTPESPLRPKQLGGLVQLYVLMEAVEVHVDVPTANRVVEPSESLQRGGVSLLRHRLSSIPQFQELA
jgi:hypothetical protein